MALYMFQMAYTQEALAALVKNPQNRAAGRLGVASTWDTAEHANFSRETAGALGEVVRRTQAIGVQLEAAEIYEIVT